MGVFDNFSDWTKEAEKKVENVVKTGATTIAKEAKQIDQEVKKSIKGAGDSLNPFSDIGDQLKNLENKVLIGGGIVLALFVLYMIGKNGSQRPSKSKKSKKASIEDDPEIRKLFK